MPYSDLPKRSFWSSCRRDAAFRMADLYEPKFDLSPGMKVATFGSCFAQHIGRYMRRSTLTVLDAEPAPPQFPPAVAEAYGYGLFSGRYGNIYTTRQLRQLIEDALAVRLRPEGVWAKADRFHDALRPNVEPKGLTTADEVRLHRTDHLRRVKAMLGQMDVMIFTLGLTETWADRATGTVFPSAPGVIAGIYDPAAHGFVNMSFADVLEDLDAALALVRGINPNLRIILTVSPVPLAATATGDHVLRANTYSKSVLRAVAEELSAPDPAIAYFPSYEIITGLPFAGQFYNADLRTVTAQGVDTVMSTFFAAHPGLMEVQAPDVAVPTPAEAEADDVVCEEILLDAFAKP